MPNDECPSLAKPVPSDAAPSRVRINAIANYVGRGWATLIALACLPLFLNLLGSEAYGLIGAFAIIQAWTLLLDFGMTPTLNREIVRARAGTRDWQSLVDLIRTIEFMLILVGAVLALIVFLAAPFLATEWLSPRQLTVGTVAQAISIMGVLAVSRWIEQAYRAVVQGTEDQVWLNVVQSISETSRWFGSLLVIYFVDRSILAFFLTNLLVSVVSMGVLRARVQAKLYRHDTQHATIRFKELHSIRGFAGGMFLGSLLAFLVIQIDKLVVGSLVPLAEFGIYALAGTAAAGLQQLVQPVSVAVLPRFTALIEAGRREELAATFRNSSQWLCLIVVPTALTIAAFPERTLLAWTGQPEIAAYGGEILTMLMLASMFNALGTLPYMLQLAHGSTALTNMVISMFLVVFLPVLVWATKTYSGFGAATTIAALNLAFLLVMPAFLLRRFLPGEAATWFKSVVFAPTLAAAGVACGIDLVMPDARSQLAALLQLAASAQLIAITVFLCLPWPRERLRAWITRRVRARGVC